MRQAGLLVWEAHQRVASMLRPGIATAEIEAAVDQFLRENDAESLFKNFPNSNPGGLPFPAVTCISINEEVVHGIPGNRRVKEGDIVSVDIGCKLDGWCGDAATTHAVGAVPPEVQQLLEVTKQVLELAIRLMGERSRWSQVAAEMERFVKSHKLSVVEAFVGHGIGREMHEDPQVPNFAGRGFRRSGDFRLAEGLVIAVEPMVNLGTKQVRGLPDQWTQVTADGRPSAHFEHTVAITDSGPLVLTAGPNGEGW
ncbi:MAG: type I methionyl aminopeptidase [Pirellulales bacterium]|nr:type I methionyl aminopeptidase [Pirellulales bacterium]